MAKRTQWPLAMSVRPDRFRIDKETFTALSAAGIHQMELSSSLYGPYFSELDFPHRSKETVNLAKEHGVCITSVHLPFGPFEEIDPASADTSVRERFLGIQTELLQAASEADIKLAIVHPSGEPYAEDERRDRISCSVDTIGRLCDRAKSLGMTLCLENLPRTCLCRTSDEMLIFLQALPDLRVVFDTNHSLIEDNVRYIRTVGSRIASLHVSDYDFADEKHLLPGEGKNDWEGILSALEDIGYAGRFLYEVKEGYTFRDVAVNYRFLIPQG